MAKKPFRPSNPRSFATRWAAIAGALASHVSTAQDRTRALDLGRTLAEEIDQDSHDEAQRALALTLAIPRLATESMHVGAADDVRAVLMWALGAAETILDMAEASMGEPPPPPPAPPPAQGQD
jgi:hypothetical protein